MTVLLAGFPVWWALGLASLAPLLVALPMAHQLLGRRPLRLPRGFGWWLLFLVWVALGAAVLFADAPGGPRGPRRAAASWPTCRRSSVGRRLGRTDTSSYQSTAAMAITPAPVYLDIGARPEDGGVEGDLPSAPRAITIDTEAALLLSEASLHRTSRVVGVPTDALRGALVVTAEPNSGVLLATAHQGSAAAARGAASATADAYLLAREDYLEQRRQHLLAQMQEQLRRLAPGDPSTFDTRHRYLNAAIDHLQSAEPSVGYVFRGGTARPVRAQHEVPLASGLGIGLAGRGRPIGIPRDQGAAMSNRPREIWTRLTRQLDPPAYDRSFA